MISNHARPDTPKATSPRGQHGQSPSCSNDDKLSVGSAELSTTDFASDAVSFTGNATNDECTERTPVSYESSSSESTKEADPCEIEISPRVESPDTTMRCSCEDCSHVISDAVLAAHEGLSVMANSALALPSKLVSCCPARINERDGYDEEDIFTTSSRTNRTASTQSVAPSMKAKRQHDPPSKLWWPFFENQKVSVIHNEWGEKVKGFGMEDEEPEPEDELSKLEDEVISYNEQKDSNLSSWLRSIRNFSMP